MKNSRSMKTQSIINLSPKRMLDLNVPNQGALCPGIDINEYLLGVHCTQCGFHQRDQENSAPPLLVSLTNTCFNPSGTKWLWSHFLPRHTMSTDSNCYLMKINVFHRLTWRCIPCHRIMGWFNKKRSFSLWNGDQSITFCLIKSSW